MTEKLSVEKRFSDIEYNLEVIRSNIAAAAKESGRRPEDIKLMAVTKTVEPIFINHAIKCGIDLIGENKVQEFLSKKDFLNNIIYFHLTLTFLHKLVVHYIVSLFFFL